MSKLILVIISGLVLAGCFHQPKPTPQPLTEVNDTTTQFPTQDNLVDETIVATPAAEAMTEATVITYSDSGFSPKSVTVKAGTTVKFESVAEAGMWVASAPHPAHTDYPGFDQKQTGTIYQFTFTKVGTWKYHNHVNTSHTGTIVVEP